MNFDLNEVGKMIHAEGAAIYGFICVRKALTPGKGFECFVQWINTEPNTQDMILEALAQMKGKQERRIIEIAN